MRLVNFIFDYICRLDDNQTVTLSASEPKYFQFMFPEGVTNVLLTVTSDDNYCMSVSVQNLTVTSSIHQSIGQHLYSFQIFSTFSVLYLIWIMI